MLRANDDCDDHNDGDDQEEGAEGVKAPFGVLELGLSEVSAPFAAQGKEG